MAKGQKLPPQEVKVKISARAWDMICKHAEKYSTSTEDVLDGIVIDYLPIPAGPPKCTLCNETGHRAKKCPNQMKLPL